MDLLEDYKETIPEYLEDFLYSFYYNDGDYI